MASRGESKSSCSDLGDCERPPRRTSCTTSRCRRCFRCSPDLALVQTLRTSRLRSTEHRAEIRRLGCRSPGRCPGGGPSDASPCLADADAVMCSSHDALVGSRSLPSAPPVAQCFCGDPAGSLRLGGVALRQLRLSGLAGSAPPLAVSEASVPFSPSCLPGRVVGPCRG